MSIFYCPYSGKKLPLVDASKEHIIPLSLGGIDQFSITVDKSINSIIGSSIDGKLANDSIMQVKRARFNAQGHSNRPAQAVCKNSKDKDGNPVQVIIARDGIRVFDPKSSSFIEGSSSTSALTSNLTLDIYNKIPFSAKVALASGYFIFGDVFIKYSRHRDLRKILKPFNKLSDDLLRSSRVRYFDTILDPEKYRSHPKQKVIESIISCIGTSSVIVSYANGEIIFFIGILGEWFSTISIPANDKMFPDTDKFDLGHIVALTPNGLATSSLRDGIEQLQEILDARKTNPI